MIVDARFIVLTSQLALQFGEHVITPMIDLCHPVKSVQQKGYYYANIKSMVDRRVGYDPIKNKFVNVPALALA